MTVTSQVPHRSPIYRNAFGTRRALCECESFDAVVNGKGRKMGHRTLGRVALLGALLSSACVTHRPSDLGSARSVAPKVIVRNDNWLDVVIYAVHGSSRIRVGTVGGSSTTTFRLTGEAANGATPLQILADPIGSRSTYVTDPVTLNPGQHLELQLGSVISTSTYAIFND
jgi:hypothetical protein